MGEVWFDAEADAAVARLEHDPVRPGLRHAVNRVLDQLETDPGHHSVRRHRFQQGLWCVTVSGDDEGWATLWEPHPGIDGGVVVQYIGPALFA